MSTERIPQLGESPVIIEPRAAECVDPALHQAIGRASLIVVSGRPLIRWGETVTYYNDNKTAYDVKLQASYLRMMHIPEVGYNHLDDEFLGEYPAISGFDPDTGVEYLFGVRPELSFSFYVPEPLNPSAS